MLTPKQAEEILRESEAMHPGRWGDHCRAVGDNAGCIARAAGLDPERAYVSGLMHDIGRRGGPGDMVHIFRGYDYMTELGQPDIARICLTHSFPVKDSEVYHGTRDCTPAQWAFLGRYLDSIRYDDYDLLIQLCDAISLPGGACLMEKRLIDVALRYGVSQRTPDRWRAFLAAKKRFDRLCGRSIYALLENVWENSLADLL